MNTFLRILVVRAATALRRVVAKESRPAWSWRVPVLWATLAGVIFGWDAGPHGVEPYSGNSAPQQTSVGTVPTRSPTASPRGQGRKQPRGKRGFYDGKQHEAEAGPAA